jgi:hypothetical protein
MEALSMGCVTTSPQRMMDGQQTKGGKKKSVDQEGEKESQFRVA